LFENNIRLDRHERSRFLDRTLVIRGDMSELEIRGGRLLPKETEGENYYSSHIHLTGVSSNFNQNSPKDNLRLAFSVIDKEVGQAETIESVKILLEFASSDVVDPDNFARMEIDLGNEDVIFADNRYIISKINLEDLIKSSGFTWNTVNVIKIYVSVFEPEETLSDKFYVCLDGLRFENVTAESPLYGLSGYSVVRNEQGRPIVKQSNSSNLVEIRFGLDVVS
jgi:hypothetical protein